MGHRAQFTQFLNFQLPNFYATFFPFSSGL